VHWLNKIANIELWKSDLDPVLDQKDKWNCLGHTLRRNTESIDTQALEWTLEGLGDRR